MNTIDIQTTIAVDRETVVQMLESAIGDCSAFYWLCDAKPHTDPTVPNEGWHWSAWNPVNGGAITVVAPAKDTDEPTEFTLNLDLVKQGLAVMASKFPQHFKSVIEKDTDDETGDVFLQCCIYGEIIYG